MTLLNHAFPSFIVPLTTALPWERQPFQPAPPAGGIWMVTSLLHRSPSLTRLSFALRTAVPFPDVLDAVFAADPDLQVLPPLDNTEGTDSISTRFLMYLPPKFAPVVLAAGSLTPRKAWERIGNLIHTGEDAETMADDCRPLLDWLCTACVCVANDEDKDPYPANCSNGQASIWVFGPPGVRRLACERLLHERLISFTLSLRALRLCTVDPRAQYLQGGGRHVGLIKKKQHPALIDGERSWLSGVNLRLHILVLA